MKIRMTVEKKRFIISPDFQNSAIGIFLMAVVLFMSFCFVDLLSTKSYGVAIVFCVLIIAVLATSLYLIRNYCKTIVINEDGVHSKCLGVKKFISWDEIQDYGISIESHAYRRDFFYPMQVNVLYYATKQQCDSTYGMKRLKGKMIRRSFADGDVMMLTKKLEEFCGKYSKVQMYKDGVLLGIGNSRRVKTNKQKTKIKIKPNFDNIVIGIVCLIVGIVMAVIVGVLLSDDDSFAALIIIVCFTVLIFALGCFCFVNDLKTLTIDKDGIRSKWAFSEKFIEWKEVTDYGIAYSSGLNSKKNIYLLYFTCEHPKQKRNGTMKFKGETVKMVVSSQEYDTFSRDVLGWCRKYTKVKPYNIDSKNIRI